MPNQNRNGLQDLDILDLDDLLSEEDTSAAKKPQAGSLTVPPEKNNFINTLKAA